MERLIWVVVLTGMLLPMSGCYLYQQGKGQLDVRWNQVPIGEAIEKEKKTEYKKLLAYVFEIKAFAENTVLLKKSENYTTYYATNPKGITFAVTGSMKTKLEPFTWWFPIVGSVPYKGFFNRADAINLKNEMEAEGLDTWFFPVTAYSTLGWFRDPVTTPMLERGRFYLTDTLIHELVHSHLFIDDPGPFNEQLASFVGEKGAEQFFQEQGLLSPDYEKEKNARRASRKKFSDLIQKHVVFLKDLYASGQSEEEILKRREELFSKITDDILLIYPNHSRERWKMNNARLLQYRRYREEPKYLNEIWLRSGKDWAVFWKNIDIYVKENFES